MKMDNRVFKLSAGVLVHLGKQYPRLFKRGRSWVKNQQLKAFLSLQQNYTAIEYSAGT